MRYHDRGASLHAFLEAIQYCLFSFGIDARKRVIEHHHCRVVREQSRDCNALLLSAGERHAALATDRIVAMCEGRDIRLEASDSRRVLNLDELGVGLAERDI